MGSEDASSPHAPQAQPLHVKNEKQLLGKAEIKRLWNQLPIG